MAQSHFQKIPIYHQVCGFHTQEKHNSAMQSSLCRQGWRDVREGRTGNREKGRSAETVGAGDGTERGSIRGCEKRKMMDISTDY